jgi:glucose dehydrogenase
MPHRAQRMVPILMALGLLFPGTVPARGADPEIDRLLQSPVGGDWITNGGNMTNQRYSTLKQIDTGNVKQLKGAWMTRLKGRRAIGQLSARRPTAPRTCTYSSTREVAGST